jgi:purine-binding chemotaxis protein CheW
MKTSASIDRRGANTAIRKFLIMWIAGQRFAIPVLQVQDVLAPQRIAWVPLAPAWVAGVLNLRGRIVTAINVRRRLGLDDSAHPGTEMSIVIEHDGNLYSLIVDDVGEVMEYGADAVGMNPTTLDPLWRQISTGIVRSDDGLLVILDVERLFALTQADAA